MTLPGGNSYDFYGQLMFKIRNSNGLNVCAERVKKLSQTSRRGFIEVLLSLWVIFYSGMGQAPKSTCIAYVIDDLCVLLTCESDDCISSSE